MDGSLSYGVEANWIRITDGVMTDVRSMKDDCTSPPVETFTAGNNQEHVVRFIRFTALSAYGGVALFYMAFEHLPAKLEREFIITEPKIKKMLSYSPNKDFAIQYMHSVTKTYSTAISICPIFFISGIRSSFIRRTE